MFQIKLHNRRSNLREFIDLGVKPLINHLTLNWLRIAFRGGLDQSNFLIH